jgi:hypothetical protein
MYGAMPHSHPRRDCYLSHAEVDVPGLLEDNEGEW